MFCVYCDHENRQERNFCAQCGATLVVECKSCSFRNYENEDYCGGCGDWIRAGGKPRHFNIVRNVADNLASSNADRNLTDSVETGSKACDSPPPIQRKLLPSRPPKAQLTPPPQPLKLSHGGLDKALADIDGFALYCELREIDSLFHEIDAGTWRRIVRSFQRTCNTVVERFDGHVARITSQGIIAYFGYPRVPSESVEESAQSAVQAAIELISTVTRLHEPYQKLEMAPLQAHIAVVSKSNGVEDASITTEKISKLMRRAQPGKLIVDDSTHKLCGTLLIPDSTDNSIRPASENNGHLVRARRSTRTASDGQSTIDTPLFGRDREMLVVKRAWQEASRGLGQILLIRGDDGSGKSRLTQEAGHRIDQHDMCDAGASLRLTFSCRPNRTTDPLFPFLQGFSLYADSTTGDSEPVRRAIRDSGYQSASIAIVIKQMFGEAVFSDAELSELTDDETGLATMPSAPSPGRQHKLAANDVAFEPDTHSGSASSIDRTTRELKLSALQSFFERLAGQGSLMIAIEDAHWIDQTSLDLLTRLIVTVRTHPILLVVTSRTEFPAQWHAHDHVQQIRLNAIDSVAAGQMISHLVGLDNAELSAEQHKRILTRATGLPLFIEQMSRSVCSRSHGQSPVTVPETLSDALHDHLGEPSLQREIALIASIIGNTFDIELLTEISDQTEVDVRHGIDQLVSLGTLNSISELIDQYQFRHSMIQEFAYSSLQRPRKIELHCAAAKALVKRGKSEKVAHQAIGWHYERAGANSLAADYYEKAALETYRESTFHEMISIAEKCLDCLRQSPQSSESLCREARLMVLLGIARRSVFGLASSEATDTFEQALHVASRTTETDIRLDAARGLFSCYLYRGDLHAANSLSSQTRQLIDSGELTHGDEIACYIEGVAAFWSGRFNEALVAFTRARTVIEQCISHDSNQLLSTEIDLHASVLGHLAWAQWITGEPEQAQETSRLALERVHVTGQPLSTTITYFLIVATAISTDSIQSAKTLIHRTGELAKTNSVDYLRAVFSILQGQVADMSGDTDHGLVLMSRGIEQMNDCEVGIGYPWILSLVASAYLRAGHIEPAHDTVIEAIRRTEVHGERHWIADLYRIKGQISVQAGEMDEARRWFHRAFETARTQGARAIELRTLLDISKLRDARQLADNSAYRSSSSADLKD